MAEIKHKEILDQFKLLRGQWIGEKKTYFEPEKLGNSSETTTTITTKLDNTFLFIQYNHKMENTDYEGVLLIGYNTNKHELEGSWIDNFHNGTAIMNLSGKLSNLETLVLNGGYSYNEEFWKWIIEISYNKTGDTIRIQHFNQPPGEQRYVGIDIHLDRLYIE